MPITSYMDNSGGLNISDSPIAMKDNQATGQSYNYDYVKTGSFSKVLGASAINTSPDAQLKTVGLNTHHSPSTDTRIPVRCAGTKIQTFDVSTGVTTNLAEDDTTATTEFLDSASEIPVSFAPFNTLDGDLLLNMAGAGMDSIKVFNGTNITSNGLAAPTGSISSSINLAAGGTFASTGTYYFAVQYRKRSTQGLSNVTLDVSATIAATTSTVTLDLTGLTGLDTTLVDKIIIWQSAVGGASAFTAGSKVAIIDSTSTTYTATGAVLADTLLVPRANNTILDNSPLESGTYNGVTAFKRRLFTYKDSTLYASDLNKPESWPTVNVVTLPSGGKIRATGVIGVPSENTTGADEYLCIWKDRELWVLTGSSQDDWQLLFVDNTGCAGHNLAVPFNGFISWITYNGIYLWNGRGKPARVSRPISALFETDGDLNKSQLSQGYGCQHENDSHIIWRVSHSIKGNNKLSIKLDTKLTAAAYGSNLESPEIDGVFLLDSDSNAYYAITSFKSSAQEETILAGDDTGYIYRLYNSSAATAFQYETKPLDMGDPTVLKSFNKVIVYLERLVDKDLTMYYWADYRNRDEYRSKIVTSMRPSKAAAPALYDIALFDDAMFDDYVPDISAVEFNLHDAENNNTGTSLKIRLEQLEADAPVRIHGFAVEWQPMNQPSIPTQQVN